MTMANLHALLRRIGIEDNFSDIEEWISERQAIETDFSATVFTGDPQHWIRYLGTNRAQRYTKARVRILRNESDQTLSFQAEEPGAQELADCLNRGMPLLRQQLQRTPHAARALDDTIFGNASNGRTPLTLRVSAQLPSDATREADLDHALQATDTCIVLRKHLVETVLQELRELGQDAAAETRLGLTWPLLRQVISYLGFPSYPRDRFIEKIDVTTRDMLIAINLLFQEKVAGRLVANGVGAAYLRHVSRQTKIAEGDLFNQHAEFRLLNELSYLLDGERWSAYKTLAKIQIREFLDSRYLRLSIASIMPELPASMAPMKFRHRKSWVSTPLPRVNHYGILNKDDLTAWKQVEAPFRDLGLFLLRQLGIGEFGRVYEALNTQNPRWPELVAVKVDRLGERRNVIQDMRTTLQISRDLATSPHVIRIFDAGQLKGLQSTFHVLQRIDGDTLSNLAGVTGHEHASVLRPAAGRASVEAAESEYLERVSSSAGEAWRREAMVAHFTRPLSLAHFLDLLTSILLWVEEIHNLNYAVNDLKGGNIMIGRRGQLKGIDMDSYSPVATRIDLLTDFFFLAMSLWLFLRFIQGDARPWQAGDDRQLRSRDSIRALLSNTWPFGDVSQISRGRLSKDEVLDLLTDLIYRGRKGVYVEEKGLFAADIERLIRLKRTLLLEEMVVD
jgi:hypothetical protein